MQFPLSCIILVPQAEWERSLSLSMSLLPTEEFSIFLSYYFTCRDSITYITLFFSNTFCLITFTVTYQFSNRSSLSPRAIILTCVVEYFNQMFLCALYLHFAVLAFQTRDLAQSLCFNSRYL